MAGVWSMFSLAVRGNSVNHIEKRCQLLFFSVFHSASEGNAWSSA
jgi:hypothetical protein